MKTKIVLTVGLVTITIEAPEGMEIGAKQEDQQPVQTRPAVDGEWCERYTPRYRREHHVG